MSSCDILNAAREWRQQIADANSLSELLSKIQLLDACDERPRQDFLQKMKSMAMEWIDEEILKTNDKSRAFVLSSQAMNILPVELLTKIFMFVSDMNDLFNASDTCVKFQKIICNPCNKYFRGIKLKMSGIPSGNKNGMYAYFVKPEGLLWLDKHKNFGAKWNEMRFMSLSKFLKHSFLLEGSAAVQVSNSCWLQVHEVHRLTQKARYLRLRPGFPEGVFDRSLVQDFVKSFVHKIQSGTGCSSKEEEACDPVDEKTGEVEDSGVYDDTVLEVRHLDIVIQVLEDKHLVPDLFPKLETISLYFGHYIDPRLRLNVTSETWWVRHVDTIYFKRTNNFTPAAYEVISQCSNVKRIIFDNAGLLSWADGALPVIPKIEHLIIRGQTPGKIFSNCDLVNCEEFTKKVTVSIRYHQNIHDTCVSNTRFLREYNWKALTDLEINIYIPFIFKWNESPCEVLTLDRFILATKEEVSKEEEESEAKQVLTCFGTQCERVHLNLRFHMQDSSEQFRYKLEDLKKEYLRIVHEERYFGDASVTLFVEYDQGTKYFEMW